MTIVSGSIWSFLEELGLQVRDKSEIDNGMKERTKITQKSQFPFDLSPTCMNPKNEQVEEQNKKLQTLPSLYQICIIWNFNYKSLTKIKAEKYFSIFINEVIFGPLGLKKQT
jgi:hypothetical protein